MYSTFSTTIFHLYKICNFKKNLKYKNILLRFWKLLLICFSISRDIFLRQNDVYNWRFKTLLVFFSYKQFVSINVYHKMFGIFDSIIILLSKHILEITFQKCLPYYLFIILIPINIGFLELTSTNVAYQAWFFTVRKFTTKYM